MVAQRVGGGRRAGNGTVRADACPMRFMPRSFAYVFDRTAGARPCPPPHSSTLGVRPRPDRGGRRTAWVTAGLIAAVASAGCASTATFRGPATLLVSAPGGPTRVSTFVLSGVVCTARAVSVTLGEGCELGVAPTSAGHATVLPGQHCALSTTEGRRTFTVVTGSLFARDREGVHVTLAATDDQAAGASVSLDVVAPAPQVTLETCEEGRARLVARRDAAPSTLAPSASPHPAQAAPPDGGAAAVPETGEARAFSSRAGR